jgi:hypothetical protein
MALRRFSWQQMMVYVYTLYRFNHRGFRLREYAYGGQAEAQRRMGKAGLLINFNKPTLIDGLKRFVL